MQFDKKSCYTVVRISNSHIGRNIKATNDEVDNVAEGNREHIGAGSNFRMSNSSAVKFTNKMGAPQSKGLVEMDKKFWSYSLEKEIMVQAQCIPDR